MYVRSGSAFTQRPGTHGATVHEMSGHPAVTTTETAKPQAVGKRKVEQVEDGLIESELVPGQPQHDLQTRLELWKEIRNLQALVKGNR